MNTCTIEIGEKEYTFCLTREAVKQIEIRGFNIQNFMDKPVTCGDILWFGGLITKQPDIEYEKAVELLEAYQKEDGDIQEVLEFLAGEYSNFINAPKDMKSKKKKKKAKIVKA